LNWKVMKLTRQMTLNSSFISNQSHFIKEILGKKGMYCRRLIWLRYKIFAYNLMLKSLRKLTSFKCW
jgi:hypothetical protein